jgi:hypothetical protein
MRIVLFFLLGLAMGFASPPAMADPETGGNAARRLSAALGGALDEARADEPAAAGGLGHGSVNSTVTPRLSRGEIFRRRVALEALAMESGVLAQRR